MWKTLLRSTLRHQRHRRQVAAAAAVAFSGCSILGASHVSTSGEYWNVTESCRPITSCEAPSETSSSSDDGSKTAKKKKRMNFTFRKRRLSTISPQHDDDDGKKRPNTARRHTPAGKNPEVKKVSYAIEIEGPCASKILTGNARMLTDFLTDLGIKGLPYSEDDDAEYDDKIKDADGDHVVLGDLAHHHHTTYAQPKQQSGEDNDLNHHNDRPFPDELVGAFSAHGIEPHPYIDRGEGASFFSSQVEPHFVTLVSQKINQDRGVVATLGNNTDTRSQMALFGVLDGHGVRGELISQYAADEIVKMLPRHRKFTKDIDAAFRETFLKVDDQIEKRHDIEPYHSGSTACVALLRNNELCVSNVGDSRAVIGRRRRPSASAGNKNKDNFLVIPDADGGNEDFLILPRGLSNPSPYECIELTKDQNAKDPKERRRIVKSGGFVAYPPEPGLPARIYLDRECTLVGLAMSRSLGDHNMKKIGVIAEPVITHHTVTDLDEFLIIASDGIWEFIDSNEAVSIVGKCLDDGCTAAEASIRLIRHAMKIWKQHEGDYRDDCTVICVRLPGLWREQDSIRKAE